MTGKLLRSAVILLTALFIVFAIIGSVAPLSRGHCCVDPQCITCMISSIVKNLCSFFMPTALFIFVLAILCIKDCVKRHPADDKKDQNPVFLKVKISC